MAVGQAGSVVGENACHAAGAWSLFRRRFDEARDRCGISTVTVEIGGCAIDLHFADVALRDSLLPPLAHLRTSAAPEAAILVWESERSGVANPFPWTPADVVARGEVPVATDGTISTAVFGEHQALSVFDAGSQTGMFWISSAERLPWYERAAPFRSLLHWILRGRDIRFAHAASVGTAAGGALIAGRGGSGKSTTALSCALAGMAYAGDDYVALDESGAVVHSLYGSAKVDSGTLAMIPELDNALESRPTGDEKGIVMMRQLPDAEVVRMLPLRVILLPRVVGGSRTSFRRATAGEAVLALAPTTMFQLPGSGGDVLASLAGLARRLPSYVIELGSDRAGVVGAVRSLIEENAA